MTALSPRETQIVAILRAHAGRATSWQMIAAELWGEREKWPACAYGTIKMLCHLLRAKGVSVSARKGYGYRLNEQEKAA